MKYVMKTTVKKITGQLTWSERKGLHFVSRKRATMVLAKGDFTNRASMAWSRDYSAGRMCTLTDAIGMGTVAFFVDEVPTWGKRLENCFYSMTEQQYNKWLARCV